MQEYAVAISYQTMEQVSVKAYLIEAANHFEAIGIAFSNFKMDYPHADVMDWDVHMDLENYAREVYRNNGGSKLHTIKAVREYAGKRPDGERILPLKDAKRLVEYACGC